MSRAALQVRGRVHVPAILPHFTTKRVLTMELIEHACDVCDVAAMRHMGIRPADVAKLVRQRPCFGLRWHGSAPHRLTVGTACGRCHKLLRT